MDANTTDQEEEARSACSDSLKTSDSGIYSAAKIDDFSPSSISDEISAEASGAVNTMAAATEAQLPEATPATTVGDAPVATPLKVDNDNGESNTKAEAGDSEVSPSEVSSMGEGAQSLAAMGMEIEDDKSPLRKVAKPTTTADNGSGSGSGSSGDVGVSVGAGAVKRRHPNRVYRTRLRIDSSPSSSSSAASNDGGDTDMTERTPRLGAAAAAETSTESAGAAAIGAEAAAIVDDESSTEHERDSSTPNEGRTSRDADNSDGDSSVDLEVHVRQANNNADADSDSLFHMSSYTEDEEDDDDEYDDDDMPHMSDANSKADSEAVKELMGKAKPVYAFISVRELMRRENGLDARNGCSLASGLSPGFQKRFYASRHVVERMKLSHCLRKHNGCVNCLNFNKAGDLLCSGSDDLRIVIWDWARNKTRHVFKSGHTENIFQTKFIDSVGCLDIISASRDGQVRRAVVSSSGGSVQTSCVYKHVGAVHKLVVAPQSNSEIISVGEDAVIRSKDLRCDNKANEMRKTVTARRKNHKVRLYSVSHHPYAPEICVCGGDCFVRVYDKRNMKQAVHEMCPEHLTNLTLPQITCCVYDSTGQEILSSYSDDHIYLFNNRAYKSGEYLHRYAGHYNHKTIKGVNFFGPNSEYVISGSDCGNIFYWDKSTEAILNFMRGDSAGVVNCLEPHPKIPILATSGLENNVKVWTPNSEIYPPEKNEELEKCVRRNLRRSVIEEGSEFDDRQFRFFIRRFMRRSRARGHNTNGRSNHPTGRRFGSGGGASSSDDNDENDDILSLSWSQDTSSSESSVDVDEYPQLEGIQCRTQ